MAIDYRDPSRRALWNRRLILASLVFTVLALPGLITNPDTGRMAFFEIYVYEPVFTVPMTLALILYPALILAWSIAFFMWTYRVARNVRALNAEADVSPGWAVGWWFVPFAQYWMPFQILRRIWKASLDPVAPDGATVPASFGMWWLMTGLSMLLGTISFRLGLNGNLPQDDLAVLDLISTAASFVSTWLSLGIIRAITEAQTQRFSAAVFE